MYIDAYTSEDFGNHFNENDILIIPIGSLEAHGHHLPLGTDIFSPRLFCKKIEELIGDEVWIAPEVPYGQTNDLSIYPGTITVPSIVLSDYLFYIGKSFQSNGFKKIIFLNGHGGNITALNLTSERLSEIGLHTLTINWWLDYSKDILTITEGQGHSGEDETSAMLYYDETLVHMDKALKNDVKPLFRVYYPERGKKLFKDALTGDATLATKYKGEKIFELITQKIVETIINMKSNKYFR